MAPLADSQGEWFSLLFSRFRSIVLLGSGDCRGPEMINYYDWPKQGKGKKKKERKKGA